MLSQQRIIPAEVGRYTKEIDAAIPDKHTKKLYDVLNKKEASILVQLRTGISRLNGYLFKIGAAESELCEYRRAVETPKHLLFNCSKWDENRRHHIRGNVSDLSLILGGKKKKRSKEIVARYRSYESNRQIRYNNKQTERGDRDGRLKNVKIPFI
jgi:hypothetical protein